MLDYTWLQELKPGDEVAYCANHSAPQIVKVDNVTATQVRVKWSDGNVSAFAKKNGVPIGHSRWNTNRIKPVTPEIRAEARKAALCAYLSHLKWETVGMEEIEVVYAILKPKESNNGG